MSKDHISKPPLLLFILSHFKIQVLITDERNIKTTKLKSNENSKQLEKQTLFFVEKIVSIKVLIN